MHRRTFLRSGLATAAASLLAGCNDGSGDPTTTHSETTTARRTTTRAVTPGPDAVPYLSVPDGFFVETFVPESSLGGDEFRAGPEPGPRMMAGSGDTLFVTVPSQGRVVALQMGNDGTSTPSATTVVSDLDRPHGIAIHDGDLYLALAGSIIRYALDGTSVDSASKSVLVDDVPRGKYHWTRSITVHDGRLYLSAGVCVSGDCSAGDEGYLGTITAFDTDGSNPSTYATGLRNAVGIGWHDGTFFATDNGADDLGQDLPPDEVDVVHEGADYGFPLCYGDNVPDPKRGRGPAACQGKVPPAATLPAHCAPLGFAFYDGDAFPADYRGDMYVALHGSWARDDPSGFKLVRIPYGGGSFGRPTDFVAGWMPAGGSNEDARGRPVDVHVGPEGDVFVTDDLAGTIYWVRYGG